MRRGVVACCCVATVMFAACNVAEWVAEEFPYPIDDYQSFAAFDRAGAGAGNVWIGRDVQQLVSARGAPDLVLEARAKYGEYRHGIPAYTYVYRPAEAGNACYDAYVIVVASGTVARYYCR